MSARTRAKSRAPAMWAPAADKGSCLIVRSSRASSGSALRTVFPWRKMPSAVERESSGTRALGSTASALMARPGHGDASATRRSIWSGNAAGPFAAEGWDEAEEFTLLAVICTLEARMMKGEFGSFLRGSKTVICPMKHKQPFEKGGSALRKQWAVRRIFKGCSRSIGRKMQEG